MVYTAEAFSLTTNLKLVYNYMGLGLLTHSSARCCLVTVKVKKVAHTRLPSVGAGADPGSWQSACR